MKPETLRVFSERASRDETRTSKRVPQMLNQVLPAFLQYTPSFPPVIYYRDTYGLDYNRMDDDSDSIGTKSTVTVRTTMNVYPLGMQESTMSRVTNASQPYQIEQMNTTRVVTEKSNTLNCGALVALGSVLTLMIFATISIFYDGCPFFATIVAACILLVNTVVVLVFSQLRPTIRWMWASGCAAVISFVLSVALFFWSVFLINSEDKFLERVGARDNRIVTSTRIAMYTLELFIIPVHGIAALVILYALYPHLTEKNHGAVTRAYFLSEPPLGHQKILVPIELRQMRSSSDSEPDQASIGVQTSGTRSQHL